MSLRRLSLEEWFITHQLAHIDRGHFFVTGFVEADLSTVYKAWPKTESFPLAHILIKALALTLREVPAARRQYVRGWLGPRMLESEDCSIIVPVQLKLDGEDYLSLTTIKQADMLSIHEIQAQVRAYRQTDKSKLIAGKYIVGKRNTWFNRSRLRLLHAFVNAFPSLQDKMGVGLGSASCLVHLDHGGTEAVVIGRGPCCVSLTACHFDQISGRIRIGLAFDHFACSGLVMGQVSIALCRILQAELAPQALLPS